jgi:hypothetical protein
MGNKLSPENGIPAPDSIAPEVDLLKKRQNGVTTCSRAVRMAAL